MPLDPSSLDRWTKQAMAPPLSKRDMAFRDQFVTEFLFDRNAKAAMIRLGFLDAFAEEYAKRFMSCPYVMGKLKERELELLPKEDAEQEAQWVLAQLKRLSMDPFAKHSTRVQALAHYARLRGMDPATKLKQEVTVEEQVQFYLPENGR